MAHLKTDQTPWKVIPLKFCTVSFYQHWVWTQFPDGEGYGGFPDYEPERPYWPNFTEDYKAAAEFAGHSDPLAYCLVHDFAHSYVAQCLLDEPSQILWALAHGESVPRLTVHEEASTLLFQRFLNERPIFATSPLVDWIKIRSDAKKLLMIENKLLT
jgi:hypothetical protein